MSIETNCNHGEHWDQIRDTFDAVLKQRLVEIDEKSSLETEQLEVGSAQGGLVQTHLPFSIPREGTLRRCIDSKADSQIVTTTEYWDFNLAFARICACSNSTMVASS